MGCRWRECSNRSVGRYSRREHLLALVFQVNLVDLGLDLCLEFVGRALKFIERPPNLSSNFRQLPGPEDNQGKQEEKEHFWKT